MPTVVVLALTLALAPAPSPSPTSGPVGDILGGVGRAVDDLFGGHGAPSATPTPSVTPTATSAPSRPPATGQPRPATPGATAAPAGSSAGVRASAAPDRPTGDSDAQEAAVPLRTGDTPAPEVPPALANPARGGWPPVSYLLVVAVLAVLALLLLRRRAPDSPTAPAPDPAPAPDSGPGPDPEPTPDNVRRLPTTLNGIYELGRLDERLEQERRRRT
ncbi:hypothetical protein [Micromonospora lupini]|uniref:hypothetical protein n=1 Tax=Micromonospora lupini TaxID=285679 RepID=UPI0033D1AB94